MSELAPEEIRELAEVAEVFSVSVMPGWKRIKGMMESLVAEAHEEMIGAVYATETIQAGLLGRWRQREAMLRAVLDYVAKAERERQRITQEIAERAREREQDLQVSGYVDE